MTAAVLAVDMSAHQPAFCIHSGNEASPGPNILLINSNDCSARPILLEEYDCSPFSVEVGHMVAAPVILSFVVSAQWSLAQHQFGVVMSAESLHSQQQH